MFVQNTMGKVQNHLYEVAAKWQCMKASSRGKEKRFQLLSNQKGEGYVDTGVKILISVVIGTLILTGLYALFSETLLPVLESKISELFNYGATA